MKPWVDRAIDVGLALLAAAMRLPTGGARETWRQARVRQREAAEKRRRERDARR